MADDRFEILKERVLVAIPRGADELRLIFTRARTSQGKEVSWHSLRVFYEAERGEWRPGKQGITIRARELPAIAEHLGRAARASSPPREQTRALPAAAPPLAPPQAVDAPDDGKIF